jgi:hypothetical protein
MRRRIQTILLTIAVTLLAINLAMSSKQKDIKSRITTLEYKLQILKETGRISGDDLYLAKDLLRPLHHPILHDPWLLRYSGVIGSWLIIAHSLLFFWNPWAKRDKETAEKFAHEQPAKSTSVS